MIKNWGDCMVTGLFNIGNNLLFTYLTLTLIVFNSFNFHCFRAHGQFVKSIIYGGLDGIVSTFVIICSIEGADFNPVYALVLGFSNLIGDAISMGMGDYLSATADIEHQKTEYKREKWCV